MLKWFRRIILFLLLGAIVNVAVAWGCAALNAEHLDHYYTHSQLRMNRAAQENGGGYVDIVRRFGFERVLYDVMTRMKFSRLADLPRFPEYEGRVWWDEAKLNIVDGPQVAVGWPMFAFRASREMRFPNRWPGSNQYSARRIIQPEWYGALDLSAISGSSASRSPVVLPYQPLPVGLATNTLLLGGITASVYYGFGFARRTLRVRAGRCPACGYPRGTSPVCTECGERLASPSARARSS